MKRPHSPLLPTRPSGQLITKSVLHKIYLKNKLMFWNTKYSSGLQKKP